MTEGQAEVTTERAQGQRTSAFFMCSVADQGYPHACSRVEGRANVENEKHGLTSVSNSVARS